MSDGHTLDVKLGRTVTHRVRPGAFVAAAVLALAALSAVFAPVLTFQDPHEQFADYPYAPPMRPHIFDDNWRPHLPFVHPIQLVDRLDRRYVEDRAQRIPIFARESRMSHLAPRPSNLPRATRLGSRSTPLGARDSTLAPVFLLGTDALGRDLWSRLLYGARASLGIAIVATLGALAIGTLAGAIAGYSGGWLDDALMRAAEVVLVLPAIYVVLALRAVMPLVLSPAQVFAGLSIVLALAGWPIVARGVRAIVAAERGRGYAQAARALGATDTRVLFVHVLPAAYGFIATQAALLIPAFVLAEATLSFVGFGFGEPFPSWGTMLQDAGAAHVFADFPWLLAPAAAIAIVSLAVNAFVSASYEKTPHVQF